MSIVGELACLLGFFLALTLLAYDPLAHEIPDDIPGSEEVGP